MARSPIAEGYFRNKGRCPGPLRGTTQKVYVILKNGMRPKEPWPADSDRQGPKTRWTLTDDSASGFDIEFWRPAE